MVRLLRALNGLIWLVLILGSGLIIISLIILDREDLAMVTAFGSFCLGVFWFIYSRWLFGLKPNLKWSNGVW